MEGGAVVLTAATAFSSTYLPSRGAPSYLFIATLPNT